MGTEVRVPGGDRRRGRGARLTTVMAALAAGAAPAAQAAAQQPAPAAPAWVLTWVASDEGGTWTQLRAQPEVEVHFRLQVDDDASPDDQPQEAQPQYGEQPAKRRAACGDVSAVDVRALAAYERELRRLRADVDGDVRPQVDSVLSRLKVTMALGEGGADEQMLAQREMQLRMLRPQVERLAWTMMELRARNPESRVGVKRPLGWMGINTAEASIMRWTSDGRVVRYCAYPVVVSVEPSSPAARGGIAAGDTLVAYDGRDLVKSEEVALDRVLVPGRTVRVTVRRAGRKVVRPVVVGERGEHAIAWRTAPPAGAFIAESRSFPRMPRTPEAPPRTEGDVPWTQPVGAAPLAPMAPMAPMTPMTPMPPAPPAPPSPPTSFAFVYGAAVTGFGGAQLVEIDGDLRDALGTDGSVLVVKVLPGTPAAKAGLRSGDVIRRVEGRDVRSPLQVQRLGARSDDRALRLDVERRGARKDVVLRW